MAYDIRRVVAADGVVDLGSGRWLNTERFEQLAARH